MTRKHFDLFPTPVTHVNIGFHDKVMDNLYDNWKFDWQDNTLKSELLNELKTRIDNEVNEYWKISGWEPAELTVFSTQMNRLNSGDHLKPHHHAGSLISWCYYVAVPEGAGAISFIDPRGNTSWDFSVKRAPSHTIMPKAGDLLIFPGWTIHYVQPNLSTESRITISGDHHFSSMIDFWKLVFNGRGSTYETGKY